MPLAEEEHRGLPVEEFVALKEYLDTALAFTNTCLQTLMPYTGKVSNRYDPMIDQLFTALIHLGTARRLLFGE